MMGKNELYMKLDTIKLTLESSATLLSQASARTVSGGDVLSESNIKSINATIHVAERMLRDILHEEMQSEDDDKEEDD